MLPWPRRLCSALLSSRQIVFLSSNVHLFTCVGHLCRLVCSGSSFLSNISAVPVALALSSRIMTGLPPCVGALAAPLVGHPVLGLALRTCPNHGRSAHRGSMSKAETKQRSLDCVVPRTLITDTRSLTASSVAFVPKQLLSQNSYGG